jgi:hypothetical protein
MSHRLHLVPVSDNRYRVGLFSKAYLLPLELLACLLAALLFPPPPAITLAALPQEPTLELTNRVLVRLETAEAKELDPWMRDDIRIAWITTLYASQGNPQPHVDATYRVLGLHPDKVWPAILARREALLGPEATPHKTMKRFPMGTGRLVDEEPTADGASSLPACDSPKKPCKSTTRERRAA